MWDATEVERKGVVGNVVGDGSTTSRPMSWTEAKQWISQSQLEGRLEVVWTWAMPFDCPHQEAENSVVGSATEDHHARRYE